MDDDLEIMSDTPSQPTAPASGMTDEDLAQQAAELVTSWAVDTPLSMDEGWALIGLQNMGSSQGEMHAFDRGGLADARDVPFRHPLG
ncbi:hypothetical protein ABZ865_33905 [Streptomyces sp. NPDC047085]|uniref:hypothetical protein n=1 Tax=Streptomyces sp. NPDC047085 TaxID=3155140 RepID=UPI0033CA1DF3